VKRFGPLSAQWTPVRGEIVTDFNQSTLDPVKQVEPPEQHMRVLGEMNELGEQQGQIIQDGVPGISMFKTDNTGESQILRKSCPRNTLMDDWGRHNHAQLI
jgi:hypothetical protein